LTQTESSASPSQHQEKKEAEVIEPSDDEVIIKTEPEEPSQLSDFTLKWYPMNVNGVIKDQFEIKYTWLKTKKFNGF